MSQKDLSYKNINLSDTLWNSMRGGLGSRSKRMVQRREAVLAIKSLPIQFVPSKVSRFDEDLKQKLKRKGALILEDC